MLAQLIFNVTYQKGKFKTKSIGHLLEYMAKREGVEKLPQMSKVLSYMGERPTVEKLGSHGLFSSADKEIRLYHEMDKLDTFDGNVYTAVVSLKREDADRLCFNSAAAWMPTIRAQMVNVASELKVPQHDLEWFAAYHDHPEHPHCHILFYSKSNKAWLTKRGIDNIKRGFMKDVLAQDLIQLYSEKTRWRHDLKKYTREYMQSLANRTANSNSQIESLLLQLSYELKNHTGKKSYGYLKPAIKKTVDAIFSLLSKDERVQELYRGWCEMQAEIIKSYQLNPDELPPIEKQKEFHSIRNQIIHAALGLQNHERNISQAATPATSIVSLLNQLSKIIYESYHDKHKRVFGVDRKQRSAIEEKRRAHGLRDSGITEQIDDVTQSM